MIAKKIDFTKIDFTPIICTIISLYFLFLCSSFPKKELIYPVSVLLLLLFFSLWEMKNSYKEGSFYKTGETDYVKNFSQFEFWGPILILFISFLYVMAMDIIGYYLSSVVLMVVSMLILGYKKIFNIIATIVIIMASIYIIFMKVYIPLPKGFLWEKIL